MNEEFDRSSIMMSYVPKYYNDSLYYKEQNKAKGKEFDIIQTIIDEIYKQINPQTATWSLNLWEEFLGIEKSNNGIEARRTEVLQKLLSIQRITPISMERAIKRILLADVEIIRNVAPYTFRIKIKENSLNCDFEILKKIVEEYKEAHMAYQTSFDLEVITIEKFDLISVKNRMEFPFWKGYKTFDGSFLFDGSELFNGAEYPDYKLYNTILLSNETVEKFKRLRNSIELKFSLNEKVKVSDLHRSEINTREKTEIVEIKNNFAIQNKEEFEGTVTIDNLWYFDGSFCFDGTKLFNASIRKENL